MGKRREIKQKLSWHIEFTENQIPAVHERRCCGKTGIENTKGEKRI